MLAIPQLRSLGEKEISPIAVTGDATSLASSRNRTNLNRPEKYDKSTNIYYENKSLFPKPLEQQN